MRTALWLVVLAGCSFEASPGAVDATATVDGRAVDAQQQDAATIDAAVPDAAAVTCKLRAKPNTLQLRSRVGGGGGGGPTNLVCPANEFPIGYGFDISNNNTENGGRSAYKVTQQCAPLGLRDSTLIVGTLSTPVVKAGGGGAMWTPATATAIITCPANSIMVGLKAFTGPDNVLFANISIKCREIMDVDLFGTEQLVAIPGTSNSNQGADEATCNSDEVLSFVETRSGAGIDSLQLQCVQLECAP
jgi:hypothetical protein